MTKLLINIDHVATLRNARGELFPDPVKAAAVCEASGADGVVFHLREDRRHITEADARALARSARGKVDFELSLAEEIVLICLDVKPDLATLVPERREELTTEGGLDVIASSRRLSEVIPRFHAAGIAVSCFIEPDLRQIDAVIACGAGAVEFHTGTYANARDAAEREEELQQLVVACTHARSADLRIHAGHGLDYENYTPFKEAMPHLDEVSIGFAVIARALFDGLPSAVSAMAQLVKGVKT